MEPENEISTFGLLNSGFLLIIFLILPIFLIIGLWPDKISDNNDSTTYSLTWFHVRLAAGKLKSDTIKKSFTCLKTSDRDSLKIDKQKADSNTPKEKPRLKPCNKYNANVEPGYKDHLIDLSTLLIILVACGGFLGNMVHVASSFISFVGAKQFKKSWLLWYFVKPFTAAGLAIALYFALRAGFLNSSSGTASINIYGIMIAAILTGLFTDNATLKLKEIFETIFKPKDERPDKLNK